MTITDRAALVLQQIDEALALADEATPGPWQITGCDKHQDKETAYVKIRGTILGEKWQIADVRFIELEGWSEQTEAERLARFIAASRTGWPTALRCLKTAIEGLLKLYDANDTSEVLNVSMTMSMSRFEANVALATICDQWEAGR